MGDWPSIAGSTWPKHGVLSTADPVIAPLATIGMAVASIFNTSTAWGTANRAIYQPVMVEVPCKIYKMSVFNGATLGGNLDLGIYDENGVKLVSSGSIAQAGVSLAQTLDITDTILNPGVYYLAMATNSATATYICSTTTALRARACGVREQLTAFALPGPATFAVFAGTFVPYIAVHYVATV